MERQGTDPVTKMLTPLPAYELVRCPRACLTAHGPCPVCDGALFVRVDPLNCPVFPRQVFGPFLEVVTPVTTGGGA